MGENAERLANISKPRNAEAVERAEKRKEERADGRSPLYFRCRKSIVYDKVSEIHKMQENVRAMSIDCLTDAISTFREEYGTDEIFFDEDGGGALECNNSRCDGDDIDCVVLSMKFSGDNRVESVGMRSYYNGDEMSINGADDVFRLTDLSMTDVAEYIASQLGGNRYVPDSEE